MNKTALIGIGGALLLLFGAGILLYSNTLTELNTVRDELVHVEGVASSTQKELQARLTEKTEEAITLAGELRLLSQKQDESERTVRTLTNTVDDLEKVIATDPELLAKYSKVYFLNENYVPAALTVVASRSTFQTERTYEVHADVAKYLDDLLQEAEKDNQTLLVVSAYRSFSQQASLKSGYRVRYGTGANAFSAEQGYSEHQLGTAIDFTTPDTGASFVGFDRTTEYAWLAQHAWRYGFILSYPKGNSYYQYEPWHWRFVGRDLARRLHQDEEWFYDLDQRTIDTYLGTLFD